MTLASAYHHPGCFSYAAMLARENLVDEGVTLLDVDREAAYYLESRIVECRCAELGVATEQAQSDGVGCVVPNSEGDGESRG